MSGAAAFVELVALHKSFGANRVLRGVSLAARGGETLSILGGSGTGKSVTLKHMIGLLHADAGRVLVEGRDVTELREREWIDVRRGFGYVFQGSALFDSLSVFENIAYPLRQHRQHAWRERAAMHARVAQCLEAVGLEGIESRMPAELSGGMRKRVGLARAIALEPKVILYDEPTTGLDPANSRRIGRLIRSLQERLGVTSVVVTHDLELCHAVSDRMAFLKDGVVLAQGSAREVAGSSLPDLRDFFGEPIGGTVHGA